MTKELNFRPLSQEFEPRLTLRFTFFMLYTIKIGSNFY